MSTPPPEPAAPSWPYCAHGADPAADPVGCRGIHVPGHNACLAHLTDTDRTAYLARLTPGADVDHRGTPFTEDLLDRLLTALSDPTTTHPHLGHARFDAAQFTGDASFNDAQFTGTAWFAGARFIHAARFDGARFTQAARFGGARFSDAAWFAKAQFTGVAWFDGVQFMGETRFNRAQFTGSARFPWAHFTSSAHFALAQFAGTALFAEVQFSETAKFSKAQFTGTAAFDEAEFTGNALFNGTEFTGDVRFDGAAFTGDAQFDGAQFLVASWLGPVACAGTVDLSGALFGVPLTLEIAARHVSFVRTRWESTATVRVRRASVDLGYAVLAAPVAVTAHPAPFTTSGTAVDESLLTSLEGVRVTSVQGVDAAHLVLTDTDLSDCLFSGAFHLDQLRLEGRTTIAPTPIGWHRRGIIPLRWTRRRALAEEHHWRAQTVGQPALPAGAEPPADRWRTGPHHPDPTHTPDPDDVVALYRQIRKSFEDGKNEPGAADFYYGECEMRRHDRTGTPKTERGLLWAYWLLSGYGLRAARALGWLAAAMLVTIVLLMAFGLPASSPKQEVTGVVPPGGGSVTFTIDKQDPKNPTKDRFTSKRFDKALSITLNSVVFRSSGQDLTTAGAYIEMTSRILEPTLLALAVLAIRGRIKR
ncbi:pentapeptide repeat-containing protein [Streptomyces sp. NPDC053541]|uniref:pentapeptide repeat-containing protein n=1 Tax=Streptomyces sp. NPDC053541 TaxID=3365709 RepID=UPI0037CCC639